MTCPDKPIVKEKLNRRTVSVFMIILVTGLLMKDDLLFTMLQNVNHLNYNRQKDYNLPVRINISRGKGCRPHTARWAPCSRVAGDVRKRRDEGCGKRLVELQD
jgi:hypothetical protein